MDFHVSIIVKEEEEKKQTSDAEHHVPKKQVLDSEVLPVSSRNKAISTWRVINKGGGDSKLRHVIGFSKPDYGWSLSGY
ncbi:hypothetical protein CEXT_182411 [Caerostris extrusa]|uniref:Uncharacterized protein n=1 Tax=Caerostris extrusa TaxID=172846 RepID=A0AAV4MCJ6_CAEEX|nr:hypothetical protein CEXT_182411 [Caerostris extrusa]